MTQSLAAAEGGIDPHRVAEVLVETGQGPGRRGSGYQVSAGTVLTAAHVVREATRVRVRFEADSPQERVLDVVQVWTEQAGDVAALTLEMTADRGEFPVIRYGRIGDRDAVVPVTAMGFPLFKLRNDALDLADGSLTQYRDSVHVVGTAAALSNRKEGTIELTVSPPEQDPDPGRSPWQGLSGAAVFSRGCLIGLISRHERSDGLNRLTAVRVERWYAQLSAESMTRLVTEAGLPEKVADLPDVIPPSPAALLTADYRAQIEDVAPPWLLGRDEELSELTEFCAGDEPYQWWQGGPWAGKTALAAWLSLHPPAGVTVVSFFITGRLAGQADSAAYTEALIQQLALIVGLPPALEATPMARDGQRRRLLKDAAARLQEDRGTLLLVVDGLDEDRGIPPEGPSSIASLLPARPPPGLRVLVTSRPYPDLPLDVPSGHPLRSCVRRQLSPSPQAEDLSRRAKDDLVEHLQGNDPLILDIIGFLTAAGGGLTLREFCELTGAPQPQVQNRLGGAFGRNLYTRSPSDAPPDQPDRVYLFQHETLQQIALDQLAYDLDGYRQKIHDWADSYRIQGWPRNTPRYLLRPYGRLVSSLGADGFGRLMQLASDPHRHERLLEYTQGDATALAEIAAAQQMAQQQAEADLAALAVLAVYGQRITRGVRNIPIELPRLWVRLGQPTRGLALTSSLPDPGARVSALSRMAEALADAGQLDQAAAVAADAERVARAITNPWHQAESLSAVADALSRAGQPDRAVGIAKEAEQGASAIEDPPSYAEVMSTVAGVLMRAGQLDRAMNVAGQMERTARADSHPFDQAYCLRKSAGLLVAAGQADRVVAIAEEVENAARASDSVFDHLYPPCMVAGVFLSVGQRDRAIALVEEVERESQTMKDPQVRASALVLVAEVLFDAGLVDRAVAVAEEAERVAQTMTEASGRAAELSRVSAVLVAGEQFERATRIALDIADPVQQAIALTLLGGALAEAGQLDRAEDLAGQAERAARSNNEPFWQPHVLIALGAALSQVGQLEQTPALTGEFERAVRTIPDPSERALALNSVVEALQRAGHSDRAVEVIAEMDRIARTITTVPRMADALTLVARALVTTGRASKAVDVVVEIERGAQTLVDVFVRAPLLINAAKLFVHAGDLDRAIETVAEVERATELLVDPLSLVLSRSATSEVLAHVGQLDRAVGMALEAERIMGSMPDPYGEPEGPTAVAGALSQAGQLDRLTALTAEMERAALALPDSYDRVSALRPVAEIFVQAGQLDRALDVAATALQTALEISDSQHRAWCISPVAELIRECGSHDRAVVLAGTVEQVALELEDGSARAVLLTSVIEVLVRARQFDRAMTLAAQVQQAANAIPDPHWQTQALTALAGALAAAGTDASAAAARQLVSQIMAGPDWTLALPILATVSPDVLESILTLAAT